MVEQPGQASVDVSVRLGQAFLQDGYAAEAVQDLCDGAQREPRFAPAFFGAEVSPAGSDTLLPRSRSSWANI